MYSHLLRSLNEIVNFFGAFFMSQNANFRGCYFYWDYVKENCMRICTVQRGTNAAINHRFAFREEETKKFDHVCSAKMR